MNIDVIAADEGVVMVPWVPELAKHLQIRRTKRVEETAVSEKSGQLVKLNGVKTEVEDLWHINNGVGVAPPAMVSYVLQALKSLGYQTTFSDVRTPCSPPDWSRLNRELRGGQKPILDAMCNERHALIRAAAGLGKTETIVQFRLINPDLRIGIVTFRGAVRNSIAQRVQEADKDRSVCIVRSGSILYEADTYVLVDKSLHRIDPSMIDVLIIDEVHGAGSEKAFDQLKRFMSLRVYGLSATPFGRHDKADMVPIALCGQVVVDLPYSFAVAVGANVPMHVFIYNASGPDNLRQAPRFVQERHGICRNVRRNALISCICRKLPEQDQVMVICKTVEHVLNLHKLLPEYTCVFNEPNEERCKELIDLQVLKDGWQGVSAYNIDPDESRIMFENNELKKVICTPVWKEGVDFPNLRWIVRADGNSNPIFNIQAGSRPSRKTNGKNVASIIDFMDRFSGLEWSSNRRIESYINAGWQVHYQNNEA